MYNGVIKTKCNFKHKFPKEEERIVIEEVFQNNTIVEQYAIKTISLEPDENVSYRDFDIVNLMKSGAINTLKETSLEPDFAKVSRNAETANMIIKEYDKLNKQVNENTETQE